MAVFLAMIVMPLLALQVDRIHHPLGHVLVGPKDAALPEHGVHQGGLAVIDVGDDGQVANVVAGGAGGYTWLGLLRDHHTCLGQGKLR
jgi:hypothetical protein